MDSLHLQSTIASLISRSGKPVLKKNIKQAAAEAEKRSPCLLLCRRIRRLFHASLVRRQAGQKICAQVLLLLNCDVLCELEEAAQNCT